MYKGKQLSQVTFPIYIRNVTPKLALSLSTFEQFFEQLTLLMVNGPSDFNYEIFLSDMPCTLWEPFCASQIFQYLVFSYFMS